MVAGQLRIEGWGWEAELFQVPESMRDTIHTVVSDAALGLRRAIDVSGLQVQRPTAGDAFVRVMSAEELNQFRFQATPRAILYQHERPEPPGKMLEEVEARLATHIQSVATPMLTAAKVVQDRILKVAIGYQLVYTLPLESGGARPNIAVMTRGAASGIEGMLCRALGRSGLAFGRLDLNVGVDHDFDGAPTELWFDLESPGNADYTRIEATISIQTRSGVGATSEWAFAPERVHRELWPKIVAFFEEIGRS